MKVHPLDEYQRPTYWKKRHDDYRSASKPTSNAFEDNGDDDHFVHNETPINIMQSTETEVRAPDPKATRKSRRISIQPYHDYASAFNPDVVYRLQGGKKRPKSRKAPNQKRRKTSRPPVSRIEDVNEEGYHIVYDEFPSTAAWTPWQRVKFPSEEPSSLEDNNESLLSTIVPQGTNRDPITIRSDDEASNGADNSLGDDSGGSQAGGRGTDQSLPEGAILQQADVEFQNLYVSNPVVPVAQMQTVDPAETLHSSSPLSELRTLDHEEYMMDFIERQHASESAQEPETQYNIYQSPEDEDVDDPAAGPMFSDPRTPPNGVAAQALALMGAADSQARSRPAENTKMTSDTVSVAFADDQRSHSSVDRIFEGDAVEAAEPHAIEKGSLAVDLCVVM